LLPDIRIEVQREITVMNWLRHNILKSPALLLRHRRINAAAKPYLQESVGGHGRESVGLAALAPREGIDGVVHLWPFTCMPRLWPEHPHQRGSEALSPPADRDCQ